MSKKVLILFILLLSIPDYIFAQKSQHAATDVNIRIIDESSDKVTPAMVCITSLKDNSVYTPSMNPVTDSISGTSTFYKGIEFNKDRNWVGPIRKMNGPGNNDDRSYVYGLLPSLPYWKDPVMYQVSGDFNVSLPPGKWHISIEHGNEYIPIEEEFVVTGKNKKLTKSFLLKRWINLPGLGWYSGDVHVHHPTNKPSFREFLLEYASAEDVHLVNVLEMGHHLGTEFKQEGFGEKFRTCRENICLVSGQEDPRSEFGHIIGLNINQLARDTSVYNYYDLVFKKLHKQPGAIVGYAHFSWNGCDLPRGFPWYVTTGEIDFVELLQFAKINTLDYYDYLDLGFRLTAAAGSDVPWGSTLGEVRTFVYIGKIFSADAWFDGLKAGHTFVSNGPALFIEADGQLPGSEIIKTKGSVSRLKVKAVSSPSIGKINRVAIYNSDGVVAEKVNSEQLDSLEMDLDHVLSHSQWLAAVVFCENTAVAHTTPVYFIVDSLPTWNNRRAPEIIKKQENAIETTEKEEREKANPDSGILIRLGNAHEFYQNLLQQIKPDIKKSE